MHGIKRNGWNLAEYLKTCGSVSSKISPSLKLICTEFTFFPHPLSFRFMCFITETVSSNRYPHVHVGMFITNASTKVKVKMSQNELFFWLPTLIDSYQILFVPTLTLPTPRSKDGRVDVACRSVTAALFRSEAYRRNSDTGRRNLVDFHPPSAYRQRSDFKLVFESFRKYRNIMEHYWVPQYVVLNYIPGSCHLSFHVLLKLPESRSLPVFLLGLRPSVCIR